MKGRFAGVRAWWRYSVVLWARRSAIGRRICDPVRMVIWRWQYQRDPEGFAARFEERTTRELQGIARLQQLADANRSPLCQHCSTPRQTSRPAANQ